MDLLAGVGDTGVLFDSVVSKFLRAVFSLLRQCLEKVFKMFPWASVFGNPPGIVESVRKIFKSCFGTVFLIYTLS